MLIIIKQNNIKYLPVLSGLLLVKPGLALGWWSLGLVAEVEALGHHGHVGEAGVAHVRHQRVRDVGRGVQDLRTRLPVPPAVPVLVAGTPVAIPVPSGTPVSIPIPVPVSVSVPAPAPGG